MKAIKVPGPTGQARYNRVPRIEIPRSQFDLSAPFKAPFDAGWLIPCYRQEVLPGDTFKVDMYGVIRMPALIRPIMDNLYFETFFFFVPNRLLWDNWERFMGSQDNPTDSTYYLVPQLEVGIPTAGEIADYLGWPIQGLAPVIANPGYQASALWHRAYNQIYNQFFRDQNLQTSLQVLTNDGPDPYSAYTLVRRGKRADMFTTALPFPAKGGDVPFLSGTAAVIAASAGVSPTFKGAGGAAGGKLLAQASASTSAISVDSPTGDWVANNALQWDNPGLLANLASVTGGPTVNSMRQAFAVQRVFEKDARGGTRYTESVRAHFGVISPDARLQRPEYLGGGHSPVVVSAVAQMSAAASQPTPQGNLAGVGTITPSRHGFVKSFTEHGVILGLCNVRADLNYQQGLPRMFSRRTRLDFALPSTAHLGEQAVLNKEIYLKGDAADEQVWGYIPRFDDYRQAQGVIAGLFRSTLAVNLDEWHLAQSFASRPVLGPAFIQDQPPVDRVVAVTSEPAFTADLHFQVSAARALPVDGIPGLVDHF